MCGIVGVATSRGALDRSVLGTMRDTLSHRGPDDFGEWWSPDGHVGFGHRRLSIIDLSPAGHQPMRDASGDLCIVFNGEIYNFVDLRDELEGKGHSFRSTSDTEVLLAAYREWGTACLARLNGMFAFALHDRRTGHVFMARDRAGEKPLFYSVADGVLRFASELKALMADPAVPRRIDLAALDCYLAVGYVLGERSILQGVGRLPPAHALQFELATGQIRTWRYWRPPPLDAPTDAEGDGALLDELETLMEDAVRRQLVADVPVGVLLSGGVDSSLVTAMAVRSTAHVKTFTIRFPGHATHDETEHARLIARHFRTDHLELEAAPSTVDMLPGLARQFDEPMADSSMIPMYLVSRLVRDHCTVALGGDGGDELFGGYVAYNRLLWTRQRVGRIPRQLRAPVSRAASAFLPLGFKGRVWLQGLDTDWDASLPIAAPFFDPKSRQRLFPGSVQAAESIWSRRIPREADLLQRATRMDFENYMAEDILVKVDRASMLTSLEVRAPLLDHRVIEFAFGKVPSSLKASATTRKVLLKRLAARVLPPQFDQRRKQGFAIPLGSWLEAGPWRRFFQEVLLGSRDALFDRRAVSEVFDGQTNGRANSERLFALVMFELWRREYRASI